LTRHPDRRILGLSPNDHRSVTGTHHVGSLVFTNNARMSWETQIAHRLFPRDQRFMARRKLRIALWVLLVGLAASAFFLGMVWWAEHHP